MKSNELRIGSWVETYDCEQNQLLIEDFALMYERNLDADEYCKPIPLTEEWAIKLGAKVWQKTDSARYFVFEDHGFDLVICPEGLICYLITPNARVFINPIEFVHQLQNTWERLTGEELKELEDEK